MNQLKQLSDMFSFEDCVLIRSCDVLFREVTLLQDLQTHKGTYVKGTEFAEVYLEFPSLLMTFMSDSPHTGYITEVEINVRIEPDL